MRGLPFLLSACYNSSIRTGHGVVSCGLKAADCSRPDLPDRRLHRLPTPTDGQTAALKSTGSGVRAVSPEEYGIYQKRRWSPKTSSPLNIRHNPGCILPRRSGCLPEPKARNRQKSHTCLSRSFLGYRLPSSVCSVLQSILRFRL